MRYVAIDIEDIDIEDYLQDEPETPAPILPYQADEGAVAIDIEDYLHDEL